MTHFMYCNYLCIKRPFKTQKLFEKMALDLGNENQVRNFLLISITITVVFVEKTAIR